MRKLLRSKYTYLAVGVMLGGLFAGGVMAQVKGKIMPTTEVGA